MNLDATKNALSCSLSQLKTINFLKNINSLLDVIDKAFSLFVVHLFITVIETFFSSSSSRNQIVYQNENVFSFCCKMIKSTV